MAANVVRAEQGRAGHDGALELVGEILAPRRRQHGDRIGAGQHIIKARAPMLSGNVGHAHLAKFVRRMRQYDMCFLAGTLQRLEKQDVAPARRAGNADLDGVDGDRLID